MQNLRLCHLHLKQPRELITKIHHFLHKLKWNTAKSYNSNKNFQKSLILNSGLGINFKLICPIPLLPTLVLAYLWVNWWQRYKNSKPIKIGTNCSHIILFTIFSLLEIIDCSVANDDRSSCLKLILGNSPNGWILK